MCLCSCDSIRGHFSALQEMRKPLINNAGAGLAQRELQVRPRLGGGWPPRENAQTGHRA
jgi:hypothetical protein